MAWQTPKTNWEIKPLDEQGRYNGDWFNWQDYERIRNNILFLCGMFGVAPFTMLSIDDTVIEYPEYTGWTNGTVITDQLRYACPVLVDRHIDPIERNLDLLIPYNPVWEDVPITKTWVGNGVTPTVEDINRWEGTLLEIYDVQNRKVQYKLPFNMNGVSF